MDRSPPRGPRGGGGGAGGRRGGGGGGGRDNERYGGRATDPYHPSRKRSRSRSPESRNYRDHYRERGDRDRGEREYPKHDGGRGGPDRDYRGGGPPRQGGGRDHNAPAPPERERDRDYAGTNPRDKSRRHRSRSRDRRRRSRSRDRDIRKDNPRSRSRERRDRDRARRGLDSPPRRTVSPSGSKPGTRSPPPPAQDTEMVEPAVAPDGDDIEAQMQAMMGIGGFGTTKQKKVKGNDVGAISKNSTTKYRQYMNRPGGFNRALSPS